MNRRFITKVIFLVLAFAAAVLAAVFYFRRLPAKNPQVIQNSLHYSYFSRKDFYEQAYSGAKPTSAINKSDIKAVIVNHHLLAASFIAETFNTIATDAPLTVLLISPNHFDAGKADVITSGENWQTPYGILPPDTLVVQKLSEQRLVSIEEDPFKQEHGVTGIVAFIKKSLPHAKVVPLIFKNRLKLQQVLRLADEYHQVLPNKIMVVGSFDFSHYLTSAAADFHDAGNLAAVENFDLNNIYHLDIDSRPGLAFFLELLKAGGNQSFHLLENSNSAKLARKDILETTSYIDGYFTEGEAGTSSVKTLLVLPPISGSPVVLSALTKTNNTLAVKFLERLFFGQDQSLVCIEGDTSLLLNQLKRYGITDFANCEKTQEFFNGKIIVNYGSFKDSFNINGGKATISIKNPLLSDSILKNGATSIAYGLAQKDGQLTITILPIGVKNGIAKLLIGAESDKILADMARNSAADELIRTQIKSGVVVINHNK